MDRGINHVVSNRSQSSSNSETDLGPIGGNGRRKLELELVELEIIEEDKNGKDLKENAVVMERSGSRAHSTRMLEISNEIDIRESGGNDEEGFSLSLTKKLESQPSSSSNSSETSDLFQVDTSKINLSKSHTIFLGNAHDGVKLELKDDGSDDFSIGSTKSEKSNTSRGLTSTSPVSDITHESLVNGMSPTQSPPIQMMDRSGGGYDPFRIPSSIFERSRSVTPMEWSVASNESLFSIHVGNASFSRDHVFMLGDLGKSEGSRKSDELTMLNPPHTIIPPSRTEENRIELENEPKTADATDSSSKDTDRLVSDDLSERKAPPPVISWNSSPVSQHFDGSESSTDSFAFPM